MTPAPESDRSAHLSAFACPHCADDSRVIDSRALDPGGVIRRRRECVRCGARWTTLERIVMTSIRVAKYHI